MARRLPADRVTFAEAGRILGLSPTAATRRVRDGRIGVEGAPRSHGRLSRGAVEAVALCEYRPSMTSGPDSYWVSTSGAAEILGVVHQRVSQLTKAGRLPFVESDDGLKLYRREQLEVVANPRRERWRMPE